MEQKDIGVLTDGGFFGLHVLNELARCGIQPRHIILENRQRNVARRLVFRARKYGWPAALTWAYDSWMTHRWERPALPLSRVAQDNVLNVPDVNAPAACERLTQAPPAIILNTTSAILKPDLLRSARFGILGFHPGALPAYSGLSPIQWQVHDGVVPGFSLFKLTQEVDGGPVYFFEKVTPLPRESFSRYCARFHRLAAKAMSEFALGICAGEDPSPSAFLHGKTRNRGLIPLRSRFQMAHNWKKMTQEESRGRV